MRRGEQAASAQRDDVARLELMNVSRAYNRWFPNMERSQLRDKLDDVRADIILEYSSTRRRRSLPRWASNVHWTSRTRCTSAASGCQGGGCSLPTRVQLKTRMPTLEAQRLPPARSTPTSPWIARLIEFGLGVVSFSTRASVGGEASKVKTPTSFSRVGRSRHTSRRHSGLEAPSAASPVTIAVRQHSG